MKQELINSITGVCQELFQVEATIVLSRPDEQFGDYATNVALQLSKQLGQNPRQVAEAIVAQLQHPAIKELTIAGPGFINISLSDEALATQARTLPSKLFVGQSWVVEYSCPNAFKELHTGHLYNTIAGDVLARIIEQAGATVHRTSFGGDVGLHVGKSLWGILQELGGELPDKLTEIPKDALERANWLSECYVAGASAYEADELSKNKIIELNQAVYQMHSEGDHESSLAKIYWECRQWSFDYFEAFYKLIKVDPMRYYPESETTERGLATVRDQLAKGVLEESDGAVVFHGDESKNLHTRVFITSKGLPTYETKDVGVILAEKEAYNFDHRLLLTGNDQSVYMKVVFAAMDAFYPGIAATMTHLTNGTVRFGDGKKMSSRLGNVSRAVDVVSVVYEQVKEIVENQELVEDITLGAIKYEFIRHRLGGDISFDVEESVSIAGNSGPYLQYAHARARSILAKATQESVELTDLEAGERSLLRKLGEYSEVIDKATRELMPHNICTYLYELAQTFNRFYEHSRVINDPRQAIRLQLVLAYADTLKEGLGLLNIVAPDKM